MRSIALTCSLLSAGVYAECVLAAEQTYELQIPAGTADESLRALARLTGHALLYRSAEVGTVRTRGLSGSYSLERALAELFRGTSLSGGLTEGGVIAVSRSAPHTTNDGETAVLKGEKKSVFASMSAFVLGLIGSPSHAQEVATNGSVVLDEIIVSAQRRDERLQDVPISISVLDGRDLDRSSSRAVSDVLNQVGGVSMIEAAPGNTQISIRGVVPDETVGTSTTGYYLDEVPFAFISISQLPEVSAFDLSRVEVLRGPQGTLYGANALSGVVRLITNDANPDGFEAKGRVRASQTEQGGDNYGGDFAVNVPLIPGQLAVRAVASYADMSGFIDSSLTGVKRINDSQVQAYRLNANYEPTDQLSIKLRWSQSRIDNGAPSRAMDDLTTPFSADQPDERIYDTYNLITEYRWSTVSLLSSTSYLDYSMNTRPEIMLGTLRLNFFDHFGLRSFGQELRLSSHLDGPWQWSAGAIYKDTVEDRVQIATPLLPLPYQVGEESKSYAVFGELTRSFADDKFALTAGLRYFQDDLDSTQQSSFFGPGIGPRSSEFDKVTGRLALKYQPQTNRTYYASVATGFRSGLSQTPEVAVLDPSLPAIDPDSLINYEMGTKGSDDAGTLSYEAAVYYTNWKDVQQSLIVPMGFVARVNAGKASGVGVDASIALHPVDALTLRANVGWSGLEFDEDVNSGSVVLFSKGARVNRSPEWSGAVSGSYRIATGMNDTDVVLSSSFNFRSKLTSRYLSGTVLAQTDSDAVRTLNMSIGLEKARWSLSLYGDNLLDERESVAPPDLTFASTSVRARPLTVGLQATFNY